MLSDPDPAIERAEEVQEETVERMTEEGVDAAGDTGESDPLQAIQDALQTFEADEIVLFTHPEGERNWLEEGVVDEARSASTVRCGTCSSSHDQRRSTGASALARISNAIVGIFSECYGRGPTKAKTYLFDNYVLCVLEDILTTVERTLVSRTRGAGARGAADLPGGDGQTASRPRWPTSSDREVVAYHSQVTFHPAMGFEMFVLRRSEDGPPFPLGVPASPSRGSG